MGHEMISTLHILGFLLRVKEGAKGEGGRILHLVICLLREELLEDGDEVNFVRMLEGGRLLSFMEA
jgi:hypothetical protein